MKFRISGTIEGETIVEASSKENALRIFQHEYAPNPLGWETDLDIEPILEVNTSCFIIFSGYSNYERPEYTIFTDRELANDCYSDHLDEGEQESLILFEGRIIKRKDQ